MNLNKGLISGHACRSMCSDVEVHFRNLEQHLIAEIEKSDLVLGCVAWITSPNILRALSDRTTCLIVDRKTPRMNQEVRDLYQEIKNQDKSEIYEMLKNGHGWRDYFAYSNVEGDPIPYSFYGDWNFEAGIYMVDGGHFRFMHHKFLLLLKNSGVCGCGKNLYEPTVWTGSYNFTKNAKTGLENAVIMRQRGIAAAYLCEWLEIFQVHATQLNITNLESLKKGYKDTNHVAYEPVCKRKDYFPLQWFEPCSKKINDLAPSL